MRFDGTGQSPNELRRSFDAGRCAPRCTDAGRRRATGLTALAVTQRGVEMLIGASRHLDVELSGRRDREVEARVAEVLFGALTRSNLRPSVPRAR